MKMKAEDTNPAETSVASSPSPVAAPRATKEEDTRPLAARILELVS